ncbi:MAG: radical SAM protein [Oligoflexia bacterium]|nr:radical SAM protein [Oligoflexia bacterium]
MRNSAIDYVCLGEGEISLLEFTEFCAGLRKIEEVDGWAYRRDGKIRINPKQKFLNDLDKLPLLPYDRLPFEKYINIGIGSGVFRPSRYFPMETSRGCPQQCTYCDKDVSSRPGYSRRSVEHILEEMRILKYKYNISELQFLDYNPLVERNRWINLCDLMIQEKLNFKWSMINGMSVRLLYNSPQMMEKCYEAGCDTFILAVESGNQQTLNNMRKEYSLNLAKIVTDRIHSMGASVAGFFLIGYLNETKEQMYETIEYARDLGMDDISFFICTPLPGAWLYDESKAKNQFDDNFDYIHLRYGVSNMKNPNITKEELEKLRFEAWFDVRKHIENNKTYLKSKYQVITNYETY